MQQVAGHCQYKEGNRKRDAEQEIEVGGTYLAKVGARSVEVRVEAENAKGGWNATALASGKPVRVKDAKHLRPAKAAGAVADPDLVPLSRLDRDRKAAAAKPKATVLPEPVWAETSRSRPFGASRTAACTGVGSR